MPGGDPVYDIAFGPEPGQGQDNRPGGDLPEFVGVRFTASAGQFRRMARPIWRRANGAGRANRKRGETFGVTVLRLVREHYIDFGPTLAAEKLMARHGLRIGVETLRQWMMAEGLWVDRRHKLPSPHQPRRRRECLGELVQIDGSEHRWFEDRGELCVRRRRDQPIDAAAVRRVRVRVRLLPRDEGLPGDARPSQWRSSPGSRLEVGDFLVRDAHGPQHAELLRLIGTLVGEAD
jgi:hypothetical protein